VWLQQLLSLSEALPLHRNTTSASWALVRKNTKEDGDNLSFTYFAMFDLTTLRGQAYAGELEALYLGKGGVALPQISREMPLGPSGGGLCSACPTRPPRHRDNTLLEVSVV
jgi:hypothetical protein